MRLHQRSLRSSFHLSLRCILHRHICGIAARKRIGPSFPATQSEFSQASAIAGEMEANLGNTGEALELVFRAMRLSPRDPRGWFITLKAAWVYFVDGQYDQAISAAKTVLNRNPRSA